MPATASTFWPAAVPHPASGWHRPALAFGLVLAAWYVLWWLAFWPGVLHQDSLAMLLEVETAGAIQSAKPHFWFWLIDSLYGPTRRVEAVVAVQVALAALVFGRLLGFLWAQGRRASAVVAAVLVGASPNVAIFTILMYADGPFAVATTGLLFECWRMVRQGRADRSGLVVVALILPFALFARANGLALLPAVLVAGWWLRSGRGWWLLAIAIAWTAALQVRQAVVPRQTHQAVFPLVLFETVNVLQTPGRFFNQPLVPPSTVAALETVAPLPTILRAVDSLYWDPLVYYSDGPQLRALQREARRTLVRDFFRYTVWAQFPTVVASRLRVFLHATWASGLNLDTSYTSHILQQTKTKSSFRRAGWEPVTQALSALLAASQSVRTVLWSPLPGLVGTLWLLVRALRRKEGAALLVAVPMALQLAGIFVFSVAAEYRYLLPYLVFPVLLLILRPNRMPHPAVPRPSHAP